MGENDIGIGKVVRLNSGGPLMTVRDIDDDVAGERQLVHCVWFASTGETTYGSFPIAALTPGRNERTN